MASGYCVSWFVKTGIAGTLPQWFANAFSNAIDLELSNNQIYGVLPRNMDAMSSMSYLHLGSNQLTGGEIPPLPRNLTYLNMSMNSSSGSLPTEFGFPYLQLQVLSLFSNQITGHIPRSICKCEYFEHFRLVQQSFWGGLRGCFVTDRISVELSKNSFFLRSFHHLRETTQHCKSWIWQEISSMEDCLYGLET